MMTSASSVQHPNSTPKAPLRLPEAPIIASEEVEKATIGALMIAPDKFTDVAGLIGADDFFYVRYQYIFAAMQALRDQNIPIDVTLLADYLSKQGQLADIGGRAMLAQLVM